MKNKLFKSLLVLIMMIGVFATVNNFSVEDIKAATNAADAPDDWAFTEDSIPLHDAILDNYGSIDTGDGQGGSPDGYISKDEAAAYTGTIDLSGKGLTGTIDGVEYFEKLTNLYLANNSLTGAIPSNIKNMAFLSRLSLENNQLSGTIPSMSGMSNLLVIYLHNNQLEGEIPSDITSITSLQYLNLANNNLEGSIPSDINKLTNMINLVLNDNNLTGSIPELNGMSALFTFRVSNNNLTGTLPVNYNGLSTLAYFEVSNNQLSGTFPTGLGQCANLLTLRLDGNKLSGSIPSEIGGLKKLQNLFLYGNLFTGELPSEIKELTDLAVIYYHNTYITTGDFTGLNKLQYVSVTKATNINLDKAVLFYTIGSKEPYSALVRVGGTAGFASWDATTTYYQINQGASYSIGYPYTDNNGNLKLIISSSILLSEDGIMDNEGNLIIGASLSDVDTTTGNVNLPNGGTVVTGEATYTFDKATTVGETEITTEGTITIANNTTTDGSTVTVGDITTIVKVPEGSEATISLDSTGGTVNAPEGSVVTNNDGSETYLTGDGTVKEDGTITSSEKTITVPTDKLIDVAVDGSEVTFPAGVIVDDGSTSITYPGTIIYDTEDNTVQYLPIDGLFNEDGTLKDSVTQDDIRSSQDFVTGLDDSALKTELQSKVEDAQNQLNERNAEKAVDDLFETDGKIKDTVTQEDIDNAKDLVDNLNDGGKKTELQDKLEDAQNQLNERNAEKAVDDLFDKDGNIKDIVTQEDIKNAEDLVNKLPDGQLKDELNDKLKEAQKQLDERNFVIVEAFKVFTGEGTVYTKIDAPVEKFSSISVDGKELDASNYEVTSGSTVITLSEAYLKTLDNGTYDVDVEFTSGAVVKTTLTVKVEGNPSKAPSTTNPNTYKPSTAAGSSTSSSTVDTGDTTNLTMLYALLASSLLGFVVITKKERNKTSK
ncbi:toxin Cry1Ac domain D-VI-related protein [Breznakia pachnodae]|uniref:Leucine-rich repeat (LRR) protein n=1 Tax=Breznakia pachnodae TaxID=265178 RepID=A0ABU0E2M0_9FIRM|nr:toxin Cry1Ac domain D-VI-related protein [Breznakia pachnodae]MDQ0360953.1 Leucine-rich repeat (LRR) protein [Breznakia pachnodae]